MAKDFLYTKAPLIEVIAEIHWELQPLLAIPNAAVDPHFPVLTHQFGDLARSAGYSRIERLVPDQVPTEMFPHKPLFRYRRPPPEEWPIFQLGPGLLAINIVPPYNGWAAFSTYIKHAVDWLFAAYPLPEKYLKLERLEVRYLDGFTKMLNYSNYLTFINEQLTLNMRIPPHLAELSSEPQHAILGMEIQLPTASPKESLAVLKLTPGKIRNDDALIMELLCRTDQRMDVQSPAAIDQWMNSAHEFLREAFGRLTSEALKTQMGPRIELEGGAA